MKRKIKNKSLRTVDNLEINRVFRDWSKAIKEATNTVPAGDLSRVLQEIDNRFNEVIDYLVFCEKSNHKQKCA